MSNEEALAFLAANNCQVVFYEDGAVNIYVPALDHTYWGATVQQAIDEIQETLKNFTPEEEEDA